MAPVLGVKIGDVVDIAESWIAVLSVDSRKSATLITNQGEKATIHSDYETEMAPGVWVRPGPARSRLQLVFEAPKRIAGPPELRQAYMRLLPDAVTVDHHSVRLEGSPAILEKLASRGLSKSSPEVLSFVREWRPREDSNLRPPV